MEAELFEQLKPMDNSAAATAAPNFGAAQFHRKHAVSDEADIFDLYFFASELFLGRGFNDRGAGFAAKQKRSGVRFRITSNQKDAFALLRHHIAEVGEGKAFATAALAIDCDNLGLFGNFARMNGIRLLRSLFYQSTSIQQRNGHAQPLQSKIILRQAASENAVL